MLKTLLHMVSLVRTVCVSSVSISKNIMFTIWQKIIESNKESSATENS